MGPRAGWATQGRQRGYTRQAERLWWHQRGALVSGSGEKRRVKRPMGSFTASSKKKLLEEGG